MIDNSYKQIYDCIHGFIWISDIACKIIDTPSFQRLKKLKQLGTCHYVYPTATHTRFEHSIGTYYLANRVLKCIAERTDNNKIEAWLKLIPTLKNYYERTYENKYPLDDYVCELIKIAALCHDLGHGPFSHVFDDIFLSKLDISNKKIKHHEYRSGLLLEYVIKNNDMLSQLIHDDEIQFMKDLINPTRDMQGFVYQIVSNKLNDLDVDKYDYLVRDTYYLGFKSSGINYIRLVDDVMVINNILCYPEQVFHDICGIFKTRYVLHKQVYCHKAVISTQFMINDLILAMEKDMNIYLKMNDIGKDVTQTEIKEFITLNDELFFVMANINKNSEAQEIINNLNYRNLYKSVGTIVSKNKLNIDKDYFYNLNPNINLDNLLIFQTKIGFVSGNKKNPLDSVFFYNRKYPDKGCFVINKSESSFMLTDNYQEHITIVFLKSKDVEELKIMKNLCH